MNNLLRKGFQPVSETEMVMVEGGSAVVLAGIIIGCGLLSGCATLRGVTKKSDRPRPIINDDDNGDENRYGRYSDR